MRYTHEGQKAEKRGPNLLHKGPEEGTEPKRCQAAEKARNTPLQIRKDSNSTHATTAQALK